MTSPEKITFENGQISVPNHPIIPFIEGDGIGPDVWAAAKRVLEAAVESAYGNEKSIVWKEIFAGEKAQTQFDHPLPEATLDACREHLVSIKGPLTTPVGKGFRSLNVSLRQELDLFVCQRPVRWFTGTPSPVREPQAVDMVIFRENTEDIYAGIEFEHGNEKNQQLKTLLKEHFADEFKKIRFPDTSGIGIKPVSQEGTSRLVRAAIRYAIEQKCESVTLVHKGNIMKFTEGAFREWGYDTAENEFPEQTYTWRQWEATKAASGEDQANAEQTAAIKAGKVIVKDVIADAMLQQVLTRPRSFDVIATLNLNGDYLSDALAAQVGGIGIAPGANINYDTGCAIFEATHGTAPKYAGQDKVNPGSLILSGEMMLRYLGWSEAADLVLNAIDDAISSKVVTYDLARLMNDATEVRCSEFADQVIKQYAA